jgi:DNA-binding GntR family transcriptional regulator
MTVGNVATRAGMPGPPVRKALIELMERGYIRRVREGTYEAESTDNDGTEQVEVVRAKPAFDEDGKP